MADIVTNFKIEDIVITATDGTINTNKIVIHRMGEMLVNICVEAGGRKHNFVFGKEKLQQLISGLQHMEKELV